MVDHPQFGKRILSERIPGWYEYYLDYKALKKIVSSLDAKPTGGNRLSMKPSDMLEQTMPNRVDPAVTQPQPPLWETGTSSADAVSPLSPAIVAGSALDLDRGSDFQTKKATFFFKLQRELDKVANCFILGRIHLTYLVR